jgi:hypothetical protein
MTEGNDPCRQTRLEKSPEKPILCPLQPLVGLQAAWGAVRKVFDAFPLEIGD